MLDTISGALSGLSGVAWGTVAGVTFVVLATLTFVVSTIVPYIQTQLQYRSAGSVDPNTTEEQRRRYLERAERELELAAAVAAEREARKASERSEAEAKRLGFDEDSKRLGGPRSRTDQDRSRQSAVLGYQQSVLDAAAASSLRQRPRGQNGGGDDDGSGVGAGVGASAGGGVSARSSSSSRAGGASSNSRRTTNTARPTPATSAASMRAERDAQDTEYEVAMANDRRRAAQKAEEEAIAAALAESAAQEKERRTEQAAAAAAAAAELERERAAFLSEMRSVLKAQPRESETSNTTTIQVRLPSGECVRRRFACDAQLAEVEAWLCLKLGRDVRSGSPSSGHELHSTFPRIVYSDSSARLDKLLLTPQAALFLSEV